MCLPCSLYHIYSSVDIVFSGHIHIFIYFLQVSSVLTCKHHINGPIKVLNSYVPTVDDASSGINISSEAPEGACSLAIIE